MIKRAVSGGHSRVLVFLNSAGGRELLPAAHEGAVLGGYRFDRYLQKKWKPVPVQAVIGKGVTAIRKVLRSNAIVFEETNAARDIINEPGNAANPATVAAHYRRAGLRAGMKVEVWNEKKLVREKCGGILAVGNASVVRPRMVIARYTPRGRNLKHLVLVGKGVTFDTGGYSIKPGAGMGAMKCDMGGSAAVFHAACAVARLKLPVKVTAITPLAENAIDGKGYRPGDILRSRSGKTVQVDNTDAEGRLILIDALDVAAELKPDVIIDAATLTGACVVALGTEIAAVYATEDKLAQRIVNSGRSWGEAFWHMPLYKPYAAGLKAPVADVRNITSDRWAGSITAALFLQHWVPDKVDWAHLDIAGSAFSDKAVNHLAEGAQGFGVKTLAELARSYCR
jgi:leucyl aminopeptidase